MSAPNIIVFFTDQQRWDTTGLHGNRLDLTPNFDRFAQQGTHCAHAFTPQPVCGPARSVMQTGRYATSTGCYRNGIPLPADAKTVANYLNTAGYTTGYIGKWHLADEEPVPEGKRGGYQHWLASNLLEFTSDAYDLKLFNNDNDVVKLPGYRVDAQTDAAIRFIDHHQADPFFLFLSYLEPHHQNHLDDYPPPVGYRARYTGRGIPPDLAALGGSTHQHLGGYYGMVKRLDEAFGRLLDALKSLGIDEQTVILFTSDHGCHFKTRNAEYKRSGHDSSIRVPMAWGGGPFEGGGQRQEFVSLVDVPPTLLDVAGIPIPGEMQGRSILPLLNGQNLDWPDDHFAQISESQVGRAIRTERWKYIVDAPGKDSWYESGAGRYVEQALYDLQADPYELTNLVGITSHRPVADRLAERLKTRMAAAGEAVPEIVPAPERPAGQRMINQSEIDQ